MEYSRIAAEKEYCVNTLEWNTVELQQLTQPSEKIISEPLPEACRVESIAEMATQSSIVAVAADSENYNYYLMKVTSNSIEKVENSKEVDYGTTMAAGCKILRANFLSWRTFLT